MSIIFVCFQVSCSIPNLEPPECSEARQKVKEFYSYHFADDMSFSIEKLEKRKNYLTERFFEELKGEQTQADVFTTGDTDFPKSFSVGRCQLVEPGKAEIDVLLLWRRDNYTSEQRLIKIEMQKQNNTWLIDEIRR
ncbi:MAG: hypothetical protein ACK419_02815 [Pyrinomonadaceae bacterium]